MKVLKEVEIGGKLFSLETGRFAKQADGAVMARYGDTMVLATVVANDEPTPGLDYFPLQVEYREKAASAGKIPGGFLKREARPSEKEILSARVIDRPIRPMFPEWYQCETQIIVTVYSSDQEHDGDVLGAGEGWAKSILYNSRANDEFSAFFQRTDSFALGVCNGCQMMSNLHSIIPGSEQWSHFVRNKSEQFEARFAMVEVLESPSLFFNGMAGSRMPIAVAHGEGFAEFSDGNAVNSVLDNKLVTMRYISNASPSNGKSTATEVYPFNPNGSPQGITGLTTHDGRFSIMMPHPERVFRAVQHSWRPDDWAEDGPWMRMFRNARKYIA